MTPPTPSCGPEGPAAALALPVAHIKAVASFTDRRLVPVRTATSVPFPRAAFATVAPVAAAA